MPDAENPPKADDPVGSIEQSTVGEPQPSINSELLDQLLDGMTDTERFVLISRFHADLSVSRLARTLDASREDIRRWLTSAVTILVHNCINTKAVPFSPMEQISPREGTDLKSE